MEKLPLLSGKELIKMLKKFGFEIKRQHGSHVFLKHADGRTTTVPVHAGEKIDRGLLIKIIRKDLCMEKEDFLKNI